MMTYLNFVRTFSNDLWFAVARSTNFGQCDPTEPYLRSFDELAAKTLPCSGWFVRYARDILIRSVMAKNCPYIVRFGDPRLQELCKRL